MTEHWDAGSALQEAFRTLKYSFNWPLLKLALVVNNSYPRGSDCFLKIDLNLGAWDHLMEKIGEDTERVYNVLEKKVAEGDMSGDEMHLVWKAI